MKVQTLGELRMHAILLIDGLGYVYLFRGRRRIYAPYVNLRVWAKGFVKAVWLQSFLHPAHASLLGGGCYITILHDNASLDPEMTAEKLSTAPG